MYVIIVTCTNTTEILSLEAAHTLSWRQGGETHGNHNDSVRRIYTRHSHACLQGSLNVINSVYNILCTAFQDLKLIYTTPIEASTFLTALVYHLNYH